MVENIIKYKPLVAFLTIAIVSSSCNGQESTGFIQDSKILQTSFTSRQPKIIKTQKSDEYQDISCGLEDKEGNLWFGTSGEGVYRYDGQFFTQFTVQDGLRSNSVRSILDDKSGNIWIGTNNGLCCYDGKIIKQFSIGTNSTELSGYSASANTIEVSSIMQDSKVTPEYLSDGLFFFSITHLQKTKFHLGVLMKLIA